MAVDQILAYQAPAFALALAQTLRHTFNALADMYDGKDGAWVDELREATLHGDHQLGEAEEREIKALFDELRDQLKPRSATFDMRP